MDARAGGGKNVSLGKKNVLLLFFLPLGTSFKKKLLHHTGLQALHNISLVFRNIHQTPIPVILKFLHLVHKRNFIHPRAPGYDTTAKFQPSIDHADMVLWQHH